MRDTQQPRVSIIIPTYNRGRRLCDTIRSLFKQDYPVYEIIIVDQTESHAKELDYQLKDWAKGRKIRWIRCKRPNLPRSRNIGALYSTGKILLFLDDDVDLPFDFVQKHVSALLASPERAAVTGRVLLPTEDPNEQRHLPFPESEIRHRVDLQLMRYSDPINNPLHIAGGNFSIWKDVFFSTAGFSHFFQQDALGEDIEFSGRLRRAGWKTYYAPDAWLIHHAENAGGCREVSKDAFSREVRRTMNMYFAFFHGSGLRCGLALAANRWRRYQSNLPQPNQTSDHGQRLFRTLGKSYGAFLGVFHAASYWRERGGLWKLHKIKAIHQRLQTHTCSVVIATLDRHEALLNCLHSLERMNCEDLEVVIVDQSATDNTEQHRNHEFNFTTKYIQLDTENASRARNIGVLNASNEFILFIDDDAEADTDLVLEHSKSLTKYSTVAVGGRVLFPRGHSMANYTPEIAGDSHRIDSPVCYTSQPTVDSLHLITCNLSVRKSAFLAVGGFDENLPGYGEDIELIARLREFGTVFYNPQAKVAHHQSSHGGTRRDSSSLFQQEFQKARYVHYSAIKAIGIIEWLAWRLRRLFRMQPVGPATNTIAAAHRGNESRIARKVCKMGCSVIAAPLAFAGALRNSAKSGDVLTHVRSRERD